MKPPFPWSLPPRTAGIQAAAVLALFYGLVYASAALLPAALQRATTPILSVLILGLPMLFAVHLFVRRDVAWRGSLGLGSQSVGSAMGWGLFGFAVAYALNVVLTLAYLLAHGNLEAQAAGRAPWLAYLADIPVEAILPLAAFVALWEETVFRGFLLGRLRAALPAPATPRGRLLRDAVAVVLCGLCFGAGHGYQGALGLMQTTTAGIVLGALAVWRGSLWPAITAHLAIDAFGLLVIKVVARALNLGASGGISL
jgi:membrane protease YdiL (CAAX protease family)